jgi:hypothetical protein
MTKSQSQQSKSEAGAGEKNLLPHEEPITSDLLLRSQHLTEHIISQVSERNNEEFGDIDTVDYFAPSTNVGYARKKIKASNLFVDNSETYRHRKKTQWLNATQNKRSGKFYSLESLVNNGVIAESEKEFFDLPPGKDYPYRVINNIQRIQKADGSEWISTLEQFVGLSAIASVVTCPVPDMMWYIKPRISYELRTPEGAYLPQGTNISDQVTKKAAIIRTTGYLGEIIGDKIYTHEWNEEIFKSCLKIIRGEPGDANNGCALSLVKENETGSGKGSASVKNVQDFILPFDEIYERLTAKEQTIKFSPRDLKSIISGPAPVEEPYK